MKDLKLTKKEKKDRKEERMEQPDYPWGVSLSFDDADVSELGLDKMSAGEMVSIKGVGKVTAKHISQNDGEDKHESVTIQVQKIEIKGHGDAEAAFNEKD